MRKKGCISAEMFLWDCFSFKKKYPFKILPLNFLLPCASSTSHKPSLTVSNLTLQNEAPSNNSQSSLFAAMSIGSHLRRDMAMSHQKAWSLNYNQRMIAPYKLYNINVCKFGMSSMFRFPMHRRIYHEIYIYIFVSKNIMIWRRDQNTNDDTTSGNNFRSS